MILILMGVEGSGKTTIGQLLAQKLGGQFADADDFHSQANKSKIAQGIPLTDADRAPWLAALRGAIDKWNAAGQCSGGPPGPPANIVLGCSALKRSYREELKAPGVQFIYLKGDYALILSRLRARHGHFAPESILQSQFADLEEPDDAITVTIDKTPDQIVTEIISKLQGTAGVS